MRLNMHRKVLAGAMALFAAFALSGCTSGGAPEPAPNDGGQKTVKVTLALAVQAGCPFCVAIQKGAEARAEKLGVELTTVSPKTPDTANQIQQLNGILASPPDVLVLQPFDGSALMAPVQQFADADVPTIMVDGGLADPSAQMSLITSNNEEGGKVAAEGLGELIGGSGKVAYFGYTPGLSSTDDREKGFTDAIKGMSGVDYVGPRYNSDDQTQAAGQVAALLASDPDIAGIFAGTEASAVGVATALREAGKDGEVKVVAFDGPPALVEALQGGALDELIVQKAFEMGELAVQQAYDYVTAGKKPEAKTLTEFVQVTRENIDDPEVARYIYPTD